MFDKIAPEPGQTHLRDASESDYYTAKRKAAAVLGHKVRPGDLPSDSEVREQVLELIQTPEGEPSLDTQPQPAEGESIERLGDHVDRFLLYKLRLAALEGIKLDPKTHPEGDALYHSLQVFDRARDLRPYDEEFLLAALLHDIGRSINPADRIAAVELVHGSVTERTLWLIAHQKISADLTAKSPTPPAEFPEWLDDLNALREADLAGRVPGAVVGTVDEALDYLKGIEAETYLEE